MQYMRQLARYGPVLYVNSIVMRKPNLSEGHMFLRRLLRKARSMCRGIIRVPEGFWVYSPVTAPVHHLKLARGINERMLRLQVRLGMRTAGLHRPVIWVNCPAACDAALGLDRRALVYQRTDRYEEFPGVDTRQITYYDRRLKQHADLTFFSNEALFEEEKDQCRKAAFVDHGVDHESFAHADQDPWIPPEMCELHPPIVGFFGGIDDHTFDMKLMADVVERLPDITFVFIGRSSIDCSLLTEHSNVVMIGQRPYEQIPHYGKCLDVCIMPWRQNRWIESCNPIKLKEYLSLGKPIVSTPFPQSATCTDLIAIATIADEFASQVRSSCDEIDPAQKEKRRGFAEQYSWHTQCMRVIRLLQEDGAASESP